MQAEEERLQPNLAIVMNTIRSSVATLLQQFLTQSKQYGSRKRFEEKKETA